MRKILATIESGRVFSQNGILNCTEVYGDVKSSKNGLPFPHKEGIARGTYRCTIPLIRASRLTSKNRGGVGKNLSEGWCLNFAVGCLHGCPFCYVDSIHKRFGEHRYGHMVTRKWGDYFLVPSNLNKAVKDTPWHKWRGVEVMMSSTHDPYLTDLAPFAGKILSAGLAEGVRFCIQTRSHLVEKDFDILEGHHDQVRLQVSIATLDKRFARKIEPRAPSPERRIKMLERARDRGLNTGVVIAPIFPSNAVRPDVDSDLLDIARALSEVRPTRIFGESLHVRGNNTYLIEKALQEKVVLGNGFDRKAARSFKKALRAHGLRGTWWPEMKKP